MQILLVKDITYFTNTLTSIVRESIPKTSNKQHNKPWFDSDCKAPIRSHTAALCKFNLQPSAENLNNFKIHRAKTRGAIKPSKKPRKIMSINLSPPSSRKKYGT